MSEPPPHRTYYGGGCSDGIALLVHLPLIRKVLFLFMGEALLIKSSSDFGGGASKRVLKTEIITESGLFVVPKAINQSFSVRIFGGGGAGGAGNANLYGGAGGGGGGGGYMNNNIFEIAEGEVIDIYIGNGGNSAGKNGETTSFGTLLSALGGSGGITNLAGGNGSSGGGAGSYMNSTNIHYTAPRFGSGGRGFQFGGGGGDYDGKHGSGGTWGGGGGTYGNITNGGDYGGNGGFFNTPAQNGINTMANDDIPLSLRGAGLAGVVYDNVVRCTNANYNGIINYVSTGKSISAIYLCGAGGGGYGGNGGKNPLSGGGGYGGNGGNGYQKINLYANGSLDNKNAFAGGGGGGGYGVKGGDAIFNEFFVATTYGVVCGGGGGAYGAGGDGLCDGVRGGGGGGGITAKFNSNVTNKLIAAPGNGGNGICIIQYYVNE